MKAGFAGDGNACIIADEARAHGTARPRSLRACTALPAEGAQLRSSRPRFDPMRLQDLRDRLRTHGAKPCHEALMLRAWMHARPLDSGPRVAADFLPLGIRRELPALTEAFAAVARIRSQHVAADASIRLLVDLHDGQSVETVLLPRDGVCVSTQVGCAVGCVFCMTGRNGLQRHLGSAEIVAQVVLARALRSVGKVVFMGMGEPAHNLGAVLEAIDLLGTEGAIGHKNLVLSTVGDRRVFERLPQQRIKPALALSLHTTFADTRRRLLPRAPQIDPDELVAEAERYARDTHYPIQYQWTLLRGINDTDDEIDGIVRLLRGKYAVMNLIPFNTVDGTTFDRPDAARATAMATALNRRGVLTKLRNSAGQDIDAGCGQLRARTLAYPASRSTGASSTVSSGSASNLAASTGVAGTKPSFVNSAMER